MTLPADWQFQVHEALKEMTLDDSTQTVFGLSLPATWKHGLEAFVRSGEVKRLFKVKAITFEGKNITRLEPPKPREGDHE